MECQQTAMLTAGRYCSPALYGQGNITGSKSDSTLSSHPLHRGHEKKIVYKSPLPPVGYPLGFPEPLPEVGRTGSFQSPANSVEKTKLSVSKYFPITHIFSKIICGSNAALEEPKIRSLLLSLLFIQCQPSKNGNTLS